MCEKVLAMGLRGRVLSGLVLLLAWGDFCSAAQNRFNISNNVSLNQSPKEQTVTKTTTTTSARTTEQIAKQTGPRHPVRAPATYWLRSFQLVNPAPGSKMINQPRVEQLDTLEGLQGLEGGELTPEQLETTETVFSHDSESTFVQKPKAVVKFERREPVPADSVAVRCGERDVTVQVKQNFLGNGQLIRPSDLTLGGCAALYISDRTLHFQAELQACGGTLTMTEDSLVYTFSLMYFPTPIGNTYVLKTNPAEVIIECHYHRRRNVSSGAVSPTWKPFASNVLAEQQLHFSLRLMTEDWQSQRPSSVYLLRDVMHVEASVLQGHHGPLRVYVDACVATASPDPASEPKYAFINNYGCLTDAKLTGAKSYFMQRRQEDKLHFQLKAFKFHREPRNSLYITCRLKATKLSVPIDSQNKACSYLTEANRWVASGGDNKVCSCCETSCGERRRSRSLGPDADPLWEGMAALGPVLLVENVLQLTQRSELPSEPASLPQSHVATQAASRPSVALLCGVGAALAALMIILTCGVVHTRVYERTGHAVCT